MFSDFYVMLYALVGILFQQYYKFICKYSIFGKFLIEVDKK